MLHHVHQLCFPAPIIENLMQLNSMLFNTNIYCRQYKSSQNCGYFKEALSVYQISRQQNDLDEK